MANFQVRMIAAYAEPNARKVIVPDDELTDAIWPNLELIFRYGQNDFQPQRICSVSVGDVVEYNYELYLCQPTGFSKITAQEYEALIDLDLDARRLSPLIH